MSNQIEDAKDRIESELMLIISMVKKDQRIRTYDYIKEKFSILENSRITDNNDYVSIPLNDWDTFKRIINSDDNVTGE